MDHDYVTRLSVVDGALKGKRALILAESPVLEPPAAAAIARFVRDDGGILIAITRPGETIGEKLYDQESWRKILPTTPEEGAPDPARLNALVKRVGKGWTVTVPGPADKPDELIATLTKLLSETPGHLSGVPPLAPADGSMDGIHTTTLKDGVLRYGAKAAAIK